MNPCYLEIAITSDDSILMIAHDYTGMETIKRLAHILPIMEQGDGWIRFKEDQDENSVGQEEAAVGSNRNGSQVSSVRAMQY